MKKFHITFFVDGSSFDQKIKGKSLKDAVRNALHKHLKEDPEMTEPFLWNDFYDEKKVKSEKQIVKETLRWIKDWSEVHGGDQHIHIVED